MLDVNTIREDFPVYKKEPNLSYLDSGASSLTPNSVIDSMIYYYAHLGGVNVNRGVYKLSHQATNLYENARKTIAKFINAQEKEIVFTRGSSSALNLVATSFGLAILKPGDEVIVSELEHHSSVLPWMNVCKQVGATLKYVELDHGRITIEKFKEVLTPKTKIVALTHVSNVLGYLTPISEIIALAHAVGAYVSVDGAQSVPHLKIDVQAMNCDFFSFSGHKMLGPSGIGVLYGKAELLKMMHPIEFGGDMNDNVEKFEVSFKDAPYKFETGTPNIAGAIGLAEACNYLENIGLANIQAHEHKLFTLAVVLLKNERGITLYSADGDTGVLAFNIDGVHPHDAASFFDEDNICLRAGHHCAQLVTKYLGCVATLRATFYLYNNENDVKKFVEACKRARDFFEQF